MTADGRSNSPVSMFENQGTSGVFENTLFVSKPPVVVNALAQLRQPVYTQVGGTPARQAGGEFFTTNRIVMSKNNFIYHKFVNMHGTQHIYFTQR